MPVLVRIVIVTLLCEAAWEGVVGTGAAWGDASDARDLVIVALPGVQPFIEETRSTSDVAAASQIYAALAAKVIESVTASAYAKVILPGAPAGPAPAGADVPGIPNRIVLSTPPGTGALAAAKAVTDTGNAWRGWLSQVFGQAGILPDTPGFPSLQWVCVPSAPGGYPDQWERAQRLLAARRMVRDFPAVPDDEWRGRFLCMLSPRWPAEKDPPPHVPAHERELKLSAVGWVKHRWHWLTRQDGFPSTASIASAPFRLAVLREIGNGNEVVRGAVRRLRDAAGQVPGASRETPVPGLAALRDHDQWLAASGGPWVYPDTWQADSLAREAGLFRPGRDREVPAGARQRLRPAVEAGRSAARALHDAMRDAMRDGPPLAGYLAVVVQDLDSMGLFLSGKACSQDGRTISMTPDGHRGVSRELLDVAAAQRAALRDQSLLGVPVYAGGDDLLAFVPAASALEAAQRCHDAIPPSLPSASTAVLFFNYHASIQRAMSQARSLLKEAKRHVEGKHGLAVGYLRRSGASVMSIQPWPGPDGVSSAGLFGLFARGGKEQLSPRLVADLERDAGELAALRVVSERRYRAELARLVRRHTEGGESVTAAAVEALDWLGLNERLDGMAGVARPHLPARVGVFLRQEAR